MCWMNSGKTAPLLCCLWKITSTTPGLSLTPAFHQHFIKIKQIWKTNTKNKMTDYTAFMVQRISPGFGSEPCWSWTPAPAYPTDTPWISKQVLAGQKTAFGNRLLEPHTPAPSGGQAARSSLPALLAPGRSTLRCKAQELAALVEQPSARAISKNTQNCSRRVEGEKEWNTEVW